MIKYVSFFIAAWFVLITYPAIACEESGRESLESNLQKWKSTGWSRYSFVLERQCFCPPEYRKATRIFVTDGKVVNANYVDTNGKAAVPADVLADLTTIEDWFEVIRKAQERKADRLNVMYDSELGYPNEIEIDMRARRADDEQSVVITKVTQE